MADGLHAAQWYSKSRHVLVFGVTKNFDDASLSSTPYTMKQHDVMKAPHGD